MDGNRMDWTFSISTDRSNQDNRGNQPIHPEDHDELPESPCTPTLQATSTSPISPRSHDSTFNDTKPFNNLGQTSINTELLGPFLYSTNNKQPFSSEHSSSNQSNMSPKTLRALRSLSCDHVQFPSQINTSTPTNSPEPPDISPLSLQPVSDIYENAKTLPQISITRPDTPALPRPRPPIPPLSAKRNTHKRVASQEIQSNREKLLQLNEATKAPSASSTIDKSILFLGPCTCKDQKDCRCHRYRHRHRQFQQQEQNQQLQHQLVSVATAPKRRHRLSLPEQKDLAPLPPTL